MALPRSDVSPIVPRLFPLDSDLAVSSVLPISLAQFFTSHFNRDMLRLNHSSTQLDVQRHLWNRSDLMSNIAAMVEDGKMQEGSSAVGIHSSGGFKLPSTAQPPEEATKLIDAALSKGTSFTLKFEYISPPRRPLKWLSEGLFNLTGIPASVHLYCSAAGARVLDPHTDPYDVLVWQLYGTKRWRACVPRPAIAAATYSAGSALTDAQRCLLQELARDNIKGCTKYSVDDTHSLLCEDFTMAPGDVLYMPKGVVHYAVTDDATQAFHLTIGLHRENMQWLDVAYHILALPVEGEKEQEHQPPAAQRVAIDLMQIYSETAEGVHLHESVPGWLLACRRPWNRPGAASIADDRHEPNERRGCAANDAELRRLFDLHIERFGGWAYHQARSGPWKLAMAVAEREKALGDQADLESVDHLFWWSGDMAFAQRLRPSEERFAQALDWIAEVVDYHNTTRPRWRRRTKGAGHHEGTRRFGEAPHTRGRTLCDQLTGWQTECRGSDPNHCEANVATNATSCETWCEGQGAWCEAAWDDVESGSCVRARGTDATCTARRGSQICRCRRDCWDEGPWQCHEEGCPARTVSCGMLSVACRARFRDIWRKPPAGMSDVRIAQVCPMSCQACVCARKDAPQGNKPQLPAFAHAKPSTAVRDNPDWK